VWWLLAFLTALPRVGIIAYPKALREGGSVHVECRVARHPHNRWLTMGLGDSVSVIQLDGEAAPVIHVRTFRAECLPEGQPQAFCLLSGTDGELRQAVQPIGVLCEG